MCEIELILLVCFELLHAWYDMELWLGRHAETGATLSENHVCPVGGVTLVVRCQHSYALFQSEYPMSGPSLVYSQVCVK